MRAVLVSNVGRGDSCVDVDMVRDISACGRAFCFVRFCSPELPSLQSVASKTQSGKGIVRAWWWVLRAVCRAGGTVLACSFVVVVVFIVHVTCAVPRRLVIERCRMVERTQDEIGRVVLGCRELTSLHICSGSFMVRCQPVLAGL